MDAGVQRFFADFDGPLTFRAKDLQRKLPIDPSRLQMLLKRHLSSDQQANAGARRDYTPRMASAVGIANSLMDIGLSMSFAARRGEVAVSGNLDDIFAGVGRGDEAVLAEFERLHWYVLPAHLVESNPDLPLGGPQIGDIRVAYATLPIGRLLVDIARKLTTTEQITFQSGAPPSDEKARRIRLAFDVPSPRRR